MRSCAMAAMCCKNLPSVAPTQYVIMIIVLTSGSIAHCTAVLERRMGEAQAIVKRKIADYTALLECLMGENPFGKADAKTEGKSKAESHYVSSVPFKRGRSRTAQTCRNAWPDRGCTSADKAKEGKGQGQGELPLRHQYQAAQRMSLNNRA